MKRLLFGCFVIIFLSLPAYAQLYVGAGAVYSIPEGDFAEMNSESLGFTLQFESRSYCKLWYGFRIDRIEYKEADDLNFDERYVETAFNISPQIRFNFLFKDCYTNTIFPYIQIGGTVSSIQMTDESAALGLGAFGGAGVSGGFSLFGLCWMGDFNASYSSPNWLLRDDSRKVYNSINVSASLSLSL